MKIKYDPPLTTWLAIGSFALASVVFCVCWYAADLHVLFGESVKAILQSRGLNVTNTSPVFYCQLPFDECLCSVLSNESHTSKKCITETQLISTRILPLISFVLEVCLIREFFSLSGNHRLVIISVLWIVSIFVFVGMTIGIYWSSCYHVSITITVTVISMFLCYLSFHNMLYAPHPTRVVSNRNRVIIPQREETTHNPIKTGLELL
jgi:hypothetical protein